MNPHMAALINSPMWRLRGPFDQASFTQKVALDGVGGDKNISRFGAVMLLAGAQEAKSLLLDFEESRTDLTRTVIVLFAHP